MMFESYGYLDDAGENSKFRAKVLISFYLLLLFVYISCIWDKEELGTPGEQKWPPSFFLANVLFFSGCTTSNYCT